MVDRIGFLMCLQTHLGEVKEGRRSSQPGSPWFVDSSPTVLLVLVAFEGFKEQTTPHRPPARPCICQDAPIVFLLKVADGDPPGAAANSKLVLFRGPLHTTGSAVDPEDDQSGLPNVVLQGPDVGVAVCPTAHNPVAVGGPVNACQGDQLKPGVGVVLHGFVLLAPGSVGWVVVVYFVAIKKGMGQGVPKRCLLF